MGVCGGAGHVIDANMLRVCYHSPSRCHFRCMHRPLTGESMLDAFF
jgi:hypothetical protein